MQYNGVKVLFFTCVEHLEDGKNICTAWKCSVISNKAAKIHTQELSTLLPAGICQKNLRF